MPSLNELLYDIRRISEHREKLTNNKINKMYKQLIKDIDGYLGGAYKKYADDDGRLFIEYLDRVNQRANFLNEISNNAYHLSNDVRDMIDEYVDKTYERSYADMRKAFYKAEQNGRFADVVKDIKAQPDVLNASFNNNIDKLKLTPALNNYRNSIVYQINQTLTIGLMQGMRYEQMAKKITERIGVSRNKANNIVRTETHRNVESGFINCAKDLSSKISNKGLVYAVTWNTLADEKVRRGVANHVIMNGKTVKVGDRFTLSDGSTTEYPGGSGVASQDCNCRCFLEYNLLTAEEFARKSIDSGGNSDIIEISEPETSKSMSRIYGEEHGKAVQEILNKSTNEQIKDMWHKYEDDFYGNHYAKPGTDAYYHPLEETVTLDINKVAKGDTTKAPYQTLFHEYGHALDYHASKKAGYNITTSISEIYQGIDKQGNPIFEKKSRGGGLLGRTARAEVREMKKSASVDTIIKDLEDKYDYIERTDLSDILEGAGIGRAYPLCSGHGLSYWKKCDNSIEIFAEMTSASLSNQASLDVIKKILPKTYKVYQDLVGVILNVK